MTDYRTKCLRHKGEECDVCGSDIGVEVHHLDGNRKNNTLDNLLPLCRPHHVKLHRSGLNGLEDQLLPTDEREHIDQSKTTFGFSVGGQTWSEWKRTVPREKSLEKRIIELVEADTEGRVQEVEEE